MLKRLILPILTASLTSSALAQIPQELTIAIGDDPGRLNPHDYGSQFVALTMLYEPLVRYGAGGKLEPGLAKSWTISKDAKTYTFNLRSGVKFSDGSPFDAKAAKFNFDRWVGTKDWDFLPTTNNIARVSIRGDLTLILTLKKPLYSTLNDLAVARPVRFLSPKAVDDKGKFLRPVGTGPWKVAEYLPERRLTFVRNDAYWGKKPKLSKVTFLLINDPQTRVSGLLANQIDVIGGEYLGALPLESLPVLKVNPNVQLLSAPGTTNYFLQMNIQKPPFNDANVRRAINMAIDRQAIAKSVFGGYAVPAKGVFPGDVPYFKATASDLYSYNPQKARALMAQGGWTPGADGILQKNGQPFRYALIVDQGVFPQARTLAQVVQDQLKKIGLAVDVQTVDYNTWIARLEKGQYDLATNLTWGAPYDPHSSLIALFKRAYGSPNSERIFSSPQLDKMIDAVLATRNEAARTVQYRRLWTYLDQQAAGVPLVSAQRLYAVRKGISGFRIAPTEYELDLSNVTVTSR